MHNRAAAAALPLACLLWSLSCACAPRPGAPARARGGAGPAALPEALPRKLVVIGINDTHGALLPQRPPRGRRASARSEVGGAAWFSAYLQAARAQAAAEGGAVVLLDAGDMFQGTMISNRFQGRSVVDVYNALGVGAAAIGNHEFDFGLAALQDRAAQARFPLLSANVFEKGTRRRPAWARPAALLQIGALKVGVIGLSTTETATAANPATVAGFEFLPGGPIAAQLATELRSQGAQVVLVTAHMGPKGEGEIVEVARACKGLVDAIVSGHNHASIGPPPLVVGNIPIVQSGSRLQAFSAIDLALDASGKVAGFSVNADSLPRPFGPMAILHEAFGGPVRYRGAEIRPDPAVLALVARYDAQVKEERERRIGETEVTLRKGGGDDLLANLASDALRSGAGGSVAARFAFQNSGGLRVSEIEAGPLTYGQIFDLYPFDNQQVVVTLPASGVRDALESVLRARKRPLSVSGLRYTVDWTRFGAGRDPEAAPPGAIVTEVIDVDGTPLCQTTSCGATACAATCAPGEYTLSVTDFLGNGGDGLSLPRDAPRRVGPVPAREIIVAYVREHSPLTARFLGSTAAGGARRITLRGAARGQAE